jgi:hypothetical protein
MKGVGLVYNELHDRRRHSTTFWVDESYDAVSNQVTFKRRPIIEIEWAKNKISEFKGTHYLKFFDHIARVDEMSLEDLRAAKEAAQRLVAEQPNEASIGQVIMDGMVARPSGFVLDKRS